MSKDCIFWAYAMYVSGASFLVCYALLLWYSLNALDDSVHRWGARYWAAATLFFAVVGAVSLAMVYYFIPCASN